MTIQTVFISSPFSGDIENNIKQVKLYVSAAIKSGYAPLAPQLYLPEFIDDNTNRLLAMDICKGLCLCTDNFWICGNKITKGMKEELETRLKYKPYNIFTAVIINNNLILNYYTI